MMGQRCDKGFEASKAERFDAVEGDAAVRGMDRALAKLLNEVGDKIAANSAAIVTKAAANGQRAVFVSLVLMVGSSGRVLSAANCSAAASFARSVNLSRSRVA